MSRSPSKSTSSAEDEWKILGEETKKALRLRHRALNTEKTYLTWLRHFQGFVREKPPLGREGLDLQNFLTYLAAEKGGSSATQNQALNAIVFVFRHVL
ncbi:MAG: site-specific integrase [Pseudomonadota bacterium]